jgi:hypothetical protein
VLNNPLRYVDPLGHFISLHNMNGLGGWTLIFSQNEVEKIANAIQTAAEVTLGVAGLAAALGLTSAFFTGGLDAPVAAALLGLSKWLAQASAVMGGVVAALHFLLWTGGTLAVVCPTGITCAATPIWSFMGIDPSSIPDGEHDYTQCSDGSYSASCAPPPYSPPDPGSCGSPIIPCGCPDCSPGSSGPPSCGVGYPGCPADGRQ